ncbi:MAG: GGDEF domain-containing protein [Pseudaminobacter sp.]|nr:GGDEF domain-containing protein [Pseudaminobacter sp.]
MNTSPFIALLNPSITLVLSATFIVLWLNQRHRPYLAVLALGYLASTVGFLLQHFTLPIGPVATRLISTASFTLAASCIAGAVVARYGRRVPFVALGVLSGGALIAFWWFMFIDPNLTWRILLVNFAFGGISLVVAAELRAIPDKGPADRILLVLALLSGLNFLVRAPVALVTHGPYLTDEGLHGSLYRTTALLSHAILSLLIALSLITVAVLDIFKALKSESHTDLLSGLLNRRGFEVAAGEALKRATELGAPAALVIADLDHFKSVNDRFGHAVGDKVIVAFAKLLRSAAGKTAIAGRLGGEEFAVLLPASNLAASSLFAEGVRAAFATSAIGELSERARLTASFGVAFRSGDEGLSELLGRADDALYIAKNGGRDSVRFSYQRPVESAPSADRTGGLEAYKKKPASA